MSTRHRIQSITSRQLDPANLSIEDRQEIVEHLTLEGLTADELAQFLHVDSRTITRDRRDLRAKNAVFADTPGLIPRLVGQLLQHTDHAIAKLRRLSRKPDTNDRDRIHAEQTIFNMLTRQLTTLQMLGYAPKLKPQTPSAATEPPSTRLQPAPTNEDAITHLLTGREADDDYLAQRNALRQAPLTPQQAWQIRAGPDPLTPPTPNHHPITPPPGAKYRLPDNECPLEPRPKRKKYKARKAESR